MSRLPNVIIAGAPKSGTSSLHTWLSDHPDALGSIPKETYYFVDAGTHMFDSRNHITNGLEGYARFFPVRAGAAPKVIFESTPSYLFSNTALNRLPQLPSRPTFLFILREPAAQIFSLFSYFQSNWNWIPAEMRFREYVTVARRGDGEFRGNELAAHAIEFGAYVDYLARWRQECGAERIRVYLYDDLRRDPKKFIQRVAADIGLDPEFYEAYSFPSENETYAVKFSGLQRLNVALRSHLPKGRLYDWIRARYRRLNTAKPQGPAHEDLQVIESLRHEFRVANQRLSTEFGLDLSSWSQPHDAAGAKT